MLLHQVLRMISNNTPVVLYDMSAKVLFKGLDKRDININYYEYTVFQVSCGWYDGDTRLCSIHIMLMK